jgi:hypothetical protein
MVGLQARHSSSLVIRYTACYCADNVAANEAIVPLLLARCNSLLVQLSEFGKPPILDTLASTGPGKARLHLFVATACSMAQRFLSPAPFPEFDESEAVPASGTSRSQLPPRKSSAN